MAAGAKAPQAVSGVFMEAYYYQHMTKPRQAAYHAMKAGFTALSPAFSVPRLEARELSDIFFQLRLDCPDILYVTGFSYRFAQGAENVELLPEYLFDKSKVKDHQKALAARVAKLARPAQAMTAWEKERYIHDFLCENVRYDKLKKPYSHEILGPLTQGVGVCEGIAKTVKALCDAAGLWCIVALCEANPEKGIRYRHAWNIVQLGGQYYHLDATFDNSLQCGAARYDYFNLDDSHIFRDHEPLVLPAPACTDGRAFYYRSVSLTKLEDVEKRAAQALRKKQPTFLFHWRGGGLNRELLLQLQAIAARLAQEKGLQASSSVNVPQAVLQFRFTDAAQPALTIQQANEQEAIP